MKFILIKKANQLLTWKTAMKWIFAHLKQKPLLLFELVY